MIKKSKVKNQKLKLLVDGFIFYFLVSVF